MQARVREEQRSPGAAHGAQTRGDAMAIEGARVAAVTSLATSARVGTAARVIAGASASAGAERSG